FGEVAVVRGETKAFDTAEAVVADTEAGWETTAVELEIMVLVEAEAGGKGDALVKAAVVAAVPDGRKPNALTGAEDTVSFPPMLTVPFPVVVTEPGIAAPDFVRPTPSPFRPDPVV